MDALKFISLYCLLFFGLYHMLGMFKQSKFLANKSQRTDALSLIYYSISPPFTVLLFVISPKLWTGSLATDLHKHLLMLAIGFYLLSMYLEFTTRKKYDKSLILHHIVTSLAMGAVLIHGQFLAILTSFIILPLTSIFYHLVRLLKSSEGDYSQFIQKTNQWQLPLFFVLRMVFHPIVTFLFVYYEFTHPIFGTGLFIFIFASMAGAFWMNIYWFKKLVRIYKKGKKTTLVSQYQQTTGAATI